MKRPVIPQPYRMEVRADTRVIVVTRAGVKGWKIVVGSEEPVYRPTAQAAMDYAKEAQAWRE